MKFNSGLEMYNYIHDGNDLYSKSLGIYIFDYNDAGALCMYTLYPEDVVELIKDAEKYDEYWGAFLGWYGSAILEEGKYDDDEHRYSEDENMRALYLKPSLDFCDETYMVDDWLDTKDVTVKYVLSE